ncbi:hypothetical protein ABPG72_016345 [Tetrahymena utriculariae]
MAYILILFSTILNAAISDLDYNYEIKSFDFLARSYSSIQFVFASIIETCLFILISQVGKYQLLISCIYFLLSLTIQFVFCPYYNQIAQMVNIFGHISILFTIFTLLAGVNFQILDKLISYVLICLIPLCFRITQLLMKNSYRKLFDNLLMILQQNSNQFNHFDQIIRLFILIDKDSQRKKEFQEMMQLNFIVNAKVNLSDDFNYDDYFNQYSEPIDSSNFRLNAGLQSNSDQFFIKKSIKDILREKFQRVIELKKFQKKQYLTDLLHLFVFFVEVSESYRIYVLQQLQIFKENHLSLKEAQQFYSVYQIFLKRRTIMRKILGVQNSFDHSYLEVIIFEGSVKKSENIIESTLSQKLEILEMMKKKEVNAEELVAKLRKMLKNKTQLRRYLNYLYQMNQRNTHLQYLINLYLESLAFSSQEINLKRKNKILQSEQLSAKNLNFSRDTEHSPNNLISFDNQTCVIFTQYIDPRNLIIKKVSSNFKDIFNLNNNQEIINHNIQKFIPKVFQQNHCKYLERYLLEDLSFQQEQSTQQIFESKNINNKFRESKRNLPQKQCKMNSQIIFFQLNQILLKPVRIDVRTNSYLEDQSFGLTAKIQSYNNYNEYILFNQINLEVIGLTKKLHDIFFPEYVLPQQINIKKIFPFLVEASLTINKISQEDTIQKQILFENLNEQTKQVLHEKYLKQNQEKNIKINFIIIQTNQAYLNANKYPGSTRNSKRKDLSSTFNTQKSLLNSYTFTQIKLSFHKIAYRDVENINYIQIQNINQINPTLQTKLLLSKLKKPKMQQIYELFFFDGSELKLIIKILENILKIQQSYLDKQFSSLQVTNTLGQIYESIIITPQQISKRSQKNCISPSEQNEIIFMNEQNLQLCQEQKQIEGQSSKNLIQGQYQANQHNSTLNKEIFDQKPFNLDNQNLILDKDANIKKWQGEIIFQNQSNQNVIENSCNNQFLIANQSPNKKNNLYPLSKVESKQNCNQVTDQAQISFKSTFINMDTYLNNSISCYSQIKNQSIQSLIEANEENVANKSIIQNEKLNIQTQNKQPQTFSSALKLLQHSIINNSKNQISNQDQDLNYYSFPTSRQDFTIKNCDMLTQIYERESERFNEALSFPKKNVKPQDEHNKNNTKLQHDQESTKSQQSDYLSVKKQLLKLINDQSTLKSIKVIYFIGALCSITIILMTWIQYIVFKQKIQDSNLDYQVFVWPITYISKLSQLLKYQNTIYLVQYCQDLHFTSSSYKQQFKNQQQENLSQIYKSLIQMAGYMDRANSDRKVFQLLRQNQINMIIAQYYNTSQLANTSSIPSLPMYTQYLTTLQHGMILQFQSMFRFVNSQGNGRSQFYLIANQLQEINLLQNVQNQLLVFQKNQQQQIEDEFSIQMSVIIVINAFCVVIIIPLYYSIQKQRDNILKLFSTFSVQKIDQQIKQIEISYQTFRHQITQTINEDLKIMKKISIFQVESEHIKRNSLSKITLLPKYNIKIYIIFISIYVLIICLPIVNKLIIQGYLTNATLDLQTMMKVYQLRSYLLDNIAINISILVMIVNPSLLPMPPQIYYDYVNSLNSKQSEIMENIQWIVNSQYQNKRFNQDLYNDFFFAAFKQNLCQTFQKYPQFSNNSTIINNSICTYSYQGFLLQGIQVAYQKALAIFPDLYYLYTLPNTSQTQQQIRYFLSKFNISDYIAYTEFLDNRIISLNQFIIAQNNSYFNYILLVQNILIYSQTFIMFFVFLISWIIFGYKLNKSLKQTKQYLQIVNIDTLLENNYALVYIQKNKSI